MNKLKNIFLSEGMLIAFITLLGYCCSFFFEFSYLSYFGLTIDFINLNLQDVIISIFNVFVVSSVYLLVSTFWLERYEHHNKEIERQLLKLICVGLFMLLFVVIFWKIQFIVIGLVFIFVVLVLFSFASSPRLLKYFINKHTKDFNIDKFKDMVNMFKNKRNSLLLQFFVFILTIMWVVFIAGRFYAISKSFLVISKDALYCLVITERGENYICKPLDLNKGVLENNILIFGRNNTDNYKLSVIRQLPAHLVME